MSDIREADYSDIPQLVEHARAFYDASPKPRPFNEEYFTAWLHSVLDLDPFYFMVSETGSFGLCVSPFYFSGEGHVQELWIWDTGGKGNALVNEMIRRARLTDAVLLGTTTQDNMQGERVGKLYERKGAKAAERVYLFDLTDSGDKAE